MADTWDLFADVAAITGWLDRSNPDNPHEDSMRVLKLVEEAGEAAAAYIGMVGQNPRKGVTHSRDLGEPILPVAVRLVADDDPAATHWAWIDAGESDPCMIYPAWPLFSICFPYGPKAEVEAGKGRIVRLAVAEMRDV